MSKEQNIEKEENFPKDPENITKNELHEHFDLDNDGKVTLEDYSEHIDYHCENPEVLEDKMEQAKYDRGFKYKKGGLVAKKLSKKETDIILNSLDFFLGSGQDDYDRITMGGIKVKYDLLEKLIDKIEYRGLSFNAKKFAEGGETISGVRVPEMEYGEVSKTEDERREIIDKHRYAKSIGDTEMADEALEQYRMFCAVKGFKKGGLTSDKAKKMLEDGTAQGKKLTDKQKRYFGYIAGGGKGKYAEGGKTYKPGDEVGIKITEYQKTDDDGYHTNYLEVYQHPTRGVWITSENGGADIVEHSKGKKGKKEVEDFIKRNNWQLVKENVAGTIELEDWDFEDYAKGGFIKVGSDRDKAHQFLRKGGYYKKYYEEVQDLVEPGDGKNTESGMFVFDNKSDASDALYEMKMKGIKIVDTDVKDYAEGGVVIHHNWDMFQRKYTGWNVLDFNDIQRVIHTFPTEEEAKRFVKRRGYKDRSNEIQIFEKGGKTNSNDKYIEEFIDEDTGESVFIERSRKEQAKKAEDSKSYNKIKKRNQMKAVRLQSEIFNISWEIKSLDSELNDIEQTIKENIFETEETAEPEGGPIANRLGAELEDLEKRKIAIKKLISKKTQEVYDLEDRLDRLDYL